MLSKEDRKSVNKSSPEGNSAAWEWNEESLLIKKKKKSGKIGPGERSCIIFHLYMGV